MASDSLQTGDRVQLKSGGPEMTVSKALVGGQWHCQWFDKGGALQSAAFAGDSLKKIG